MEKLTEHSFRHSKEVYRGTFEGISIYAVVTDCDSIHIMAHGAHAVGSSKVFRGDKAASLMAALVSGDIGPILDAAEQSLRDQVLNIIDAITTLRGVE